MNIIQFIDDSDEELDEEIDEEILNKLNEIEKQYNKNKKKDYLSVSDLVLIEWCEQKHKLIQEYGKLEATSVMKKGTERHNQLELEIHDLIPIQTETYVDRQGCKLLDSILRIQVLLETGTCRELPIMGFINERKENKSVFILGIIDLVKIKDNKIFLFENKTRQSSSLPKLAQLRNTKFQLMIYSGMLNELINFNNSGHKENSIYDSFFFNVDAFLEAINCKETQFSSLFIEELNKYNIHEMLDKTQEEQITLNELILLTMEYYAKLLPISKDLEIIYESQSTKQVINKINFKYDNIWLNDKIQVCLNYYFKIRTPIGVTDIEEATLKCAYCDLANKCTWRQNMADKLIKK